MAKRNGDNCMHQVNEFSSTTDSVDMEIDEGDRDQFDLSVLEVGLMSTIAEKFSYKDLVTFNNTSRLADAAVNQIPKVVQHHFEASHVVITKNIEAHYRLEGYWKQRPLEAIPECVHLTTRRLDLYWHPKVLELIEKYRMKSRELFVEVGECNTANFSKILQAIAPRRLSANGVRSEMFNLPSFKQLEKIDIFTRTSCKDMQLLGLKATKISILGVRLTVQGLARFLKEWADGKRQLDQFFINSVTFGVPEIIEEIGITRCAITKEDPHTIYICKHDIFHRFCGRLEVKRTTPRRCHLTFKTKNIAYCPKYPRLFE